MHIPAESIQHAMNLLPVGVAISDLNRRILYINQIEADLHGWTIEELLGRDVRVFAPPDQWQRTNPEHITSWQGLQRETLNITKTGEIFPVRLLSEILPAPDSGEPYAILTICEDIRQQKALQTKFFTEHALFRSTLQAMPDLILIVDHLFRIHLVNMHMQTFLGLPHARFPDETAPLLTDMFDPLTARELLALLQQPIPLQQELVIPHDALPFYPHDLHVQYPSHCWLLLTITPIMHPAQDDIPPFQGAILVMRDISEYKRSHQALETSYDDLFALSAQMHTLSDISSLMASQMHDVSTLLSLICQSAVDFAHADAGSIYLVQNTTPRTITRETQYHTHDHLTCQFWQAATTHLQTTVLDTRRPLWISDLHSHEDTRDLAPQCDHAPITQCAYAALPFIVGDDVLGLLDIHLIDPLFGPPWDHNMQTLLVLLANHAALALYHATLYKTAKQTMQQATQFLRQMNKKTAIIQEDLP